jgi:hypoxanthine phosphoribosyltransferase
MAVEKRYIEEEELLCDAYRLAASVYASGFRPSVLVGLWRGGSSVAIAVQECLQYLGVSTDHLAVRTSYSGVTGYANLLRDAGARIRVHGTQYLLETLTAEDRLLVVDDVHGSGYSVDAVLRRLRERTRRNMPREVRVAVVWHKPERNRTGRLPDYHVHETDDWLVLPYELDGLSVDEIRRHKPCLAGILDELQDVTVPTSG